MLDPIFLLEAVINGILLGGVLALLALGLNLIFGVIDIVWIAYVDLVTLCMYAVYFLVSVYGWPLWLAGLAAIVVGALLGVLRAPADHHARSWRARRSTSCSPPAASSSSSSPRHPAVEHRPPVVRVNLPTLEVGGIFISFTRLLAFAPRDPGHGRRSTSSSPAPTPAPRSAR